MSGEIIFFALSWVTFRILTLNFQFWKHFYLIQDYVYIFFQGGVKLGVWMTELGNEISYLPFKLLLISLERLYSKTYYNVKLLLLIVFRWIYMQKKKLKTIIYKFKFWYHQGLTFWHHSFDVLLHQQYRLCEWIHMCTNLITKKSEKSH